MDQTQERLLQMVQELKDRQRFWKINTFEPYGWQKAFIEASSTCTQILAMTGNRCGKTFSGGAIMAIHLTGLYPVWWLGKRWDRAITAWAAGISTDTTRDILQSELLGDWKNPEAYGTGAIPKELIMDTVNKPGTPGAVQTVLVKHVSGGISTLDFKSYEMSQDKFMGTAKDLIWLDEECPKSVYTQCVTRTATTGGITMLTFTPEHGLTEIVKDFMYEIKPGQFMVTASWDDAPHLDEKVKEQLMSVYTPSERAMRVSGQPSLGSGVVFPVPEGKIVCDPFPIPEHWLKIIGIDLGFDHPNAVANVAWDNERDIYYLYDEYSEKGETLSMHANAIRAKGGVDIPVIVPHDAFKHDGATSGRKFVDMYKDYGLAVVYQPFSNPPGVDGKPSGNSVEYGVNFILRAMEEGRFKAFTTCTKFLQETKIYHRKDGKIIDKGDDLISAVRYAILSIGRFGKPGSAKMNSGYYWDSKTSLAPTWHAGVV
jgi:phage terminase large subunit-like protein